MKVIPKMLLNHIMHDVQSTTGKNLRSILLQTGKHDVSDLCKLDARSISYFPLSKEEAWKEIFLNELVDTRDRNLHVEGFGDDEFILNS